MAKNKNKNNGKKGKTLAQKIAAAAKSVAKSPSLRPLANAAMQMLDKRGYDHAQMFYDPCHARLQESAYKGEKGYVNRFTADQTLNIAASGEMIVEAIPQGFWYNINSNAAAGGTYTIAAAAAAFPGFTFLSTNAVKYRIISMCITLTPLGTLTNQSGQLWFGNSTARELVSDSGVALARTVNALQQLLPTNITATSVINGGLDVKWVPSNGDEWYVGMSATGAGVDYSSVGALVLVGTGLPAASSVNVRTTVIIEWMPNPGLGIAYDPTDFPAPSKNTVWDVLGWLKRRDVNWWYNHAGKAAVAAGRTAIGMLPGASAAKTMTAFL